MRFYSGGSFVGSGTSDASGNFVANVSAGPTTFTLGTVPSFYYSAFTYQGKNYSSLDTTCKAPGPTAQQGGNVQMPNAIHVMLTSGPPPPPPSGCF